MKKCYLTILLVIIGHFLHAQITLTSATHLPQPGDTFTYVVNPELPTSDFRKGGANQTWDFSTFGGTADNFIYSDLAGTPDSAFHPLSNVVETAGMGSQNYYVDTTAGRVFSGHYSPTLGRVVYSDLREFLLFPITYNNVFNETFAGETESFQNGSKTQRGGTIEIAADGFGDLILPYTTIYNVLRVKTIVVYSDTFSGTPLFNYNDTIYTWYNSSNHNFVASVSIGYISGILAFEQSTYLDETVYTVGLDDLARHHQLISFYPNPTRKQLFIENKTGRAVELGILDMNGRLLQAVILQEEKMNLQLKELPPGLYFLRYGLDEQFYMEKLLIE